jgi:hypothetical protein
MAKARPSSKPVRSYDPGITNVSNRCASRQAYDFKLGSAPRVPCLLTFEQQHGLEHDRHIYNTRLNGEARQRLVPVLGTHAGF